MKTSFSAKLDFEKYALLNGRPQRFKVFDEEVFIEYSVNKDSNGDMSIAKKKMPAKLHAVTARVDVADIKVVWKGTDVTDLLLAAEFEESLIDLCEKDAATIHWFDTNYAV